MDKIAKSIAATLLLLSIALVASSSMPTGAYFYDVEKIEGNTIGAWVGEPEQVPPPPIGCEAFVNASCAHAGAKINISENSSFAENTSLPEGNISFDFENVSGNMPLPGINLTENITENIENITIPGIPYYRNSSPNETENPIPITDVNVSEITVRENDTNLTRG